MKLKQLFRSSYVAGHDWEFAWRPARRIGVSSAVVALLAGCGGSHDDGLQQLTQQSAQQMALHPQGQQIFRFDIFGDEALWTDRLRMHEVIASALDPTIDLT